LVNYSLSLPKARANVPGADHLSARAEQRLTELTDKLTELTVDVSITADDIIRILTIHAQCCKDLAEQALAFAREDANLQI